MSWRDLLGVVAPEVLERARSTSNRLDELAVPHAVIGGIAVGVLGYPRATRDVDFLIGREGSDPGHPQGFTADVAALYEHGVVEFLFPRDREPDRSVLADALLHTRTPAGEVPVIGARELVWLKLGTPASRRAHDHNDVRQLLRVGAIDAADILDWLELLDPHKAEDFAELVQDALE